MKTLLMRNARCIATFDHAEPAHLTGCRIETNECARGVECDPDAILVNSNAEGAPVDRGDCDDSDRLDVDLDDPVSGEIAHPDGLGRRGEPNRLAPHLYALDGARGYVDDRHRSVAWVGDPEEPIDAHDVDRSGPGLN